MPRGFVFTINNHQEFPKFNETSMIGMVTAEQIGDKGTYHIQGVVFFKKDKSARDAERGLNLSGRCWIERMKGTWKEAIKYIEDGHGTNIAPAHHDGRSPTATEEEEHKSKQGKRKDIESYIAAIEEGSSELALMRSHGSCWARFEGLKDRVKRTTKLANMTEITWPVTLFGITIQAPDPTNKKRHLWIWGATSISKTHDTQMAFKGKRVYMAPEESLYRFEGYDDQDVIIYDDVHPGVKELIEVSNTWECERERFGKARYMRRYWKEGHSRMIIVLSNRLPPLSEAFDARFNVIHLNPSLAQAPVTSTGEDSTRGSATLEPAG